MEWENTLHKGYMTHTEHDDVSDDEVSSTSKMEISQMMCLHILLPIVRVKARI